MYQLLKRDKRARLGVFSTVHGEIRTPAFMNVATAAAIKGGLSAHDLADIGCQVMLCNTYHLHLRPGDEVIRNLGGLRGFTGFTGPVLTDSGGFQVFSLAGLRSIDERGVTFASHIDGQRIFMGPEESIRIQSHLGSTIAMAFDECIPNPAPEDYVRQSVDRTTRWLERCIAERERLRAAQNMLNPAQLLFGINQGGTYEAIRAAHMVTIAGMELDGYAIGGLAVGESNEEMYRIIDAVEPLMPVNKPRYLMGVGTPADILEAVGRGIDLFDCVMPSRNARHGHLFTSNGVINLNNRKHMTDGSPPDPECGCHTCRTASRAYLRHLLKAGEMLGYRLAVLHNLYFYNRLMADIRESVAEGRFEAFAEDRLGQLGKRV